MINLVGDFWGPDDQKCLLRVLLRFEVWGSKTSGRCPGRPRRSAAAAAGRLATEAKDKVWVS